MNEVSMTPASSLKIAPAASSKGSVEVATEKTGKESPPASVNNNQEVAKADKTPPKEVPEVNVEQAVASINDYVQSVQRDLQFTVDEELDRTIVKVVDSRSGELIRQIPEEAFLELARKLNDGGDLQLIDAMG